MSPTVSLTPSPTLPPAPTITFLDPLDGDTFQDQCLIPATVAVDFMEYEASLETSEFDFLFVLDRSGSMVMNDPQDFTKVAAFNLMDFIPLQKVIASGVVIFGGGDLIQPLTTDRSAVRNALFTLPPRNLGTDIEGALLVATDELKTHGRNGYAKFMILLSDGESYAEGALNAARDSGYPIHTFHLGNPTSGGAVLLNEIAASTGGSYTHVDDPTLLPDLFQSALNKYTARVSHMWLTSSFDPERVVSAVPNEDGDTWISPELLAFGPTTFTAHAITNEIPPRYAEASIDIVARTGGLTDALLDIVEPTEMQLVGDLATNTSDVTTTVTGTASIVLKPGVQSPPYDPCILINIDSVETSSTAAREIVVKSTPKDGMWIAPGIPLRLGPGQITLIYATATTTDYPPKRITTIRRVIAPLPCRPISEVAEELSESLWEPYNRIPPFDAFTLTDSAAGLDFDLPGPVGIGYFGFYQTRDDLCPTPEGVNVARVFLGQHRAGTTLLPDCRVRVFRADNQRSYFCRVNELNGRTLPAHVDVPYMSDGVSGLRVAVDLLGFDRKNGGGWTFMTPLSPESTWSFPIHTSVGSASVGTYEGEFGYDASGSSVAAAGDVNGDGYTDFLIGARDSAKARPGAGKVYLVLGKARGWHRWTDIWFTEPSFVGEKEADFTGTSVAGVGDVNGDGYDDFVIGAPENADRGFRAGKTYLFLGRADGWGMERSVAEADATFVGEAVGDQLGSAVAGAGDVNGDGLDDFLIGAPYHAEGFYGVGKTYLILGKPMGWGPNQPMDQTEASFLGELTNDYAGLSLAGAGDVNGDGFDDFLIGAMGSDQGGADAGQTYLILGKNRGWARNYPLEAANGSFVGEAAGDLSATAIAGAGDVNGDGFDDFLIGAPYNSEASPDAGQAYLFLGRTAGWPLRTSLAAADATFHGETKLSQAGFAVGGAGDVNGDGFDDFLIGAIHSDLGHFDAGAAYLVMGATGGWSRDTSLATIPHAFHGERSGDLLGFQVVGVGDANGDSIDDFLLGAPGNADGGPSAGHTYLILGGGRGPRFVAGLAGATPPPPTSSASLELALADLNESSWEPYRRIPPFQESILTDTTEGLELRILSTFGMGFFSFWQTRDSFAPPPAGPHFLRVHLKHNRVPGFLLPDCRVRVFTADNSVAYFAQFTEAPGGALPTILDVPFLSDGVWPIRVAVELLSFDQRMYRGWSVEKIELDPQGIDKNL